jgi:hypothetical protein
VRRARSPRWALSFADLSLLLLGFFVLLQARPEHARLAAGLREAMGAHPRETWERSARAIFLPGEAILRPAAKADLVAAAGDGAITVVSRGTDPATNRFDGWELAAARAAALARALAEAGVPQERIAIDLAPGDPAGQTLTVTRR